MSENDNRKQELEKQLGAPDAVLEPSVWSIISKYIDALKKANVPQKDRVATVVTKLAGSYVGYPEMACLVCDWLQTLEQSSFAMRPGPANGVAASQPVHDAQYFLAELVKETFQPHRYLDAFEHGAPPHWAQALIADPRGRQLIYELAGQHTNSVLLGWAIRRILADGHEAEVARTGSAMAGYFGVFYRLLGQYLSAALRATGSAAAWEQTFEELCSAALQGQHTYVLTQAILSRLGSHPHAVVLDHLRHELMQRARDAAGGRVHVLQRLFVERAERPDGAAVELVSTLLQSPPHMLKAAPLQRLAAMYHASPAPALAIVRQPQACVQLFALLTDALFAPQRRAYAADVAEPAAELLAIASCLVEQDSSSSPTRREGTGASDDGWAAVRSAQTACLEAAKLLFSFFRSSYLAADTFDEIDAINNRVDVASIMAPFHVCLPLSSGSCWNHTHALADVEHGRPAARSRYRRAVRCHRLHRWAALQVMSQPVAAVCFVDALRHLLAAEDFYTDAISLAALPHVLLVLIRIIRVQPCAHARIIALVCAALPVTSTELAKAYLRVLLDVMLAGRVREVMMAVEGWAPQADPSLVRHFVVSVLAFCDRPYSSEFAARLLELMLRSDVQRKREVGKVGELRNRLLHLFAQEVLAMRFAPPLRDEQLHYVRTLARDLQ